MRSGKKHHTHSKAMAWIALDRLIQMNEMYNLNIDISDFVKTAHELKQNIEKYGHSNLMDSYTTTYGSQNVDASLLMLPLLDYDPNEADRLLGTIRKIKEKLSYNHLIYRYLGRNDGLRGDEGAFGACSFWMVEALAKFGFKSEAKALFQDLLKKSNSLQLWPEELDPDTGEFLEIILSLSPIQL